MRVVLDTNVLVSGLLTASGPCARLLDFMSEGGFQPVFNEEITTEYEKVLLRPEFGFETQSVHFLILRIRSKGIRSVQPFPPAGLPDPHDETFLEAARGQENAYLVTGNLKHYPHSKCHGIKVLSPRQFLEVLGGLTP